MKNFRKVLSNDRYASMLSKSLVLGGYHEIFENKKPQINADERGFVIAYLRLFAFIGVMLAVTQRHVCSVGIRGCALQRRDSGRIICGFFNSNTKTFYNLYASHTLSIIKRGVAL